MWRSTRTLLAALPLGVFPLVARDASSVRAPRAEGYIVAMAFTTNEGRSTERMSITFKMAGEKLRLEMDISGMLGAMGGAGDAADAMKGAYMLLQGEGKVAMIMPSFQNPMSGGTGMGMVLDMKSMMGMARETAAVSVDSALDNISVEDLGPGEAILGHPTRRYRMTERATKNGTTESEVSEVWLATDLAEVEAGFKKFGDSFTGNLVGSLSASGKIPPGFPMRMVAMAGAKEMMRFEVSRAEKANIEDKEFEVPAGIQLMDMTGMMKRGH